MSPFCRLIAFGFIVAQSKGECKINLVSYITRDSGGAARCPKYAEKQAIPIKNIALEEEYSFFLGAKNKYLLVWYDKLDDFADLNYQQIKLTIVTVTGDIQLSANYTLTQSNVSYSVEQLNMLPSNGDLTGISPEYKTTHTGFAKIVDGKVTELDGEEVNLPTYEFVS